MGYVLHQSVYLISFVDEILWSKMFKNISLITKYIFFTAGYFAICKVSVHSNIHNKENRLEVHVIIQRLLLSQDLTAAFRRTKKFDSVISRNYKF